MSSQLALDGFEAVTSTRTIFIDPDTGERRPARKEPPTGCFKCSPNGVRYPVVYCFARRGEGGLCYCPDHLDGALRERGLDAA